MLLFPLHRLCLTPCHLLGIRLLAMLTDIPDASGTVGTEDDGKQLADEVGIDLALFHVTGAFCTGGEAFCLTAGTDFAPCRFLVLSATRAFSRKVFAARSAVQSASGDKVFVCCYLFHCLYCPPFGYLISSCANSPLIQYTASVPTKRRST